MLWVSRLQSGAGGVFVPFASLSRAVVLFCSFCIHTLQLGKDFQQIQSVKLEVSLFLVTSQCCCQTGGCSLWTDYIAAGAQALPCSGIYDMTGV